MENEIDILLTFEDLLEESQKRNLDLGSKPDDTIKKYVNLGLLPKPVRRKKREGKGTQLYYPPRTIEKLAHVKALKSEGLTLEEVRDSFAIMYVKNALTDLFDEADDENRLHRQLGFRRPSLFQNPRAKTPGPDSDCKYAPERSPDVTGLRNAPAPRRDRTRARQGAWTSPTTGQYECCGGANGERVDTAAASAAAGE